MIQKDEELPRDVCGSQMIDIYNMLHDMMYVMRKAWTSYGEQGLEDCLEEVKRLHVLAEDVAMLSGKLIGKEKKEID